VNDNNDAPDERETSVSSSDTYGGFLFARLSLTFRSCCAPIPANHIPARVCNSSRGPLGVAPHRPVALTTIFPGGFSCSSFATRPRRHGACFFYRQYDWIFIFSEAGGRWTQSRSFSTPLSRAIMRRSVRTAERVLQKLRI